MFYNTIFTVIMYAIFRSNNNCKFEKLCYANENIKISVKRYLCYHKNVMVKLKRIALANWKYEVLENVIACLSM